LAGTRAGQDDTVARVDGVSCKAFVDIGGKPMIERVVSALQESAATDRIIISMPDNLPVKTQAPALSSAFDEGILDHAIADRSPVQSLLKLLPMLADETPFLVTTADHALLSATVIRQFLEQYEPARFDIAAAMLPLECLSRKYPEQKRTSLMFRGVGYKACNLFVFGNKKVAEKVLLFWLAVEEKRKSPWQMVWHLGPLTLARYLTGTLALPGAVARLGARTGTRLQAVMLKIPEAAIDVDTPQDLEFVRSIVAPDLSTSADIATDDTPR